MTKPKFVFKFLLFLVTLNLANAFAQTEDRPPTAEPCYEIVLQVLTASNQESDKNAASPALAPIVKRLRTLYAFTDYRLTTTYFQRASNSLEYKSQTSDFNREANTNEPVYVEWSLKNLRPFRLNSDNRQTIQFDSFRFNARVPVMIQTKSEDGKSSAVVSYELIGITNSRLSLKENEPTIVGSLTTSKTGGLIFLVLTVKAVE